MSWYASEGRRRSTARGRGLRFEKDWKGERARAWTKRPPTTRTDAQAVREGKERASRRRYIPEERREGEEEEVMG